MPTTPPTLTDAPASPDRADRATFSARAIALDNFTKNTQIPEARLMSANVYANAVEAADAATAAAASAATATATTNVTKWVSGTTYAQGVAVWSPANFATYRRSIAGAGTTDPSADATNWALILPLPSQTGKAGRALVTDGTGASWGETGVKGADISSAATINLTTATGNFVHVTGTTTITAITIPIGAERAVVFDGALTLTHSAALLLPGAANIPTAAGDRMIVRGDTAGAIVIDYVPANGQALTSTMAFLGSATVGTAVAAINFLTIFTSAFDRYLVTINVFPSSADTLMARAAVAGALHTGAAYYCSAGDGVTGAAATTAFQLGIGAGGGLQAWGLTLDVTGANDTAGRKSISAFGTYMDGTPRGIGIARSCTPSLSSILTGFGLYWSAGQNFQPGSIVRVYGIRNS